MDAGRAADRRIAGGDGAGALQQALERLGGGKIRPRRALADADARCRSWRRSSASRAPARRPSPACRSRAPTGSPRRRSRRHRACPAARRRCRSRTRPHGRAPSANALPSAPTATCIERAHITLSLATLPSVPHTLPGIGQRSAIWKSSATSSRAPTSSWRRSRSTRSWRRWRRWPASRRPISAAARSAGTRASPRPACR